MARTVKVDEYTPRSLWYCTEDSAESGDGGECRSTGSSSSSTKGDCNDDGGGDGCGGDTPSCSTGVAVRNDNIESVESAGAVSGEAKTLSACSTVSSPDGSPDEAVPSSRGRYRDGVEGLSMCAMEEALLYVDQNWSNDPITCVGSVRCEGKGDSGEVQTQTAELRANDGKMQGVASQPTTPRGLSQARRTVDTDTVTSDWQGDSPNWVWEHFSALRIAATRPVVGSRVPAARVICMVLNPTACSLIARGFRWPDGVEKLAFVDHPMFPACGPAKDALAVGVRFNRPSESVYVPWPAGLKHIHLCSNWNIHLYAAQANWSPSLETIQFPADSNRPLTGGGAELPWGLREIDLGKAFNQPLIGVEWPPLLRKLMLSDKFDQSLEGVMFPEGLREIRMPHGFNRDISRVIWPKGLEVLRFGLFFNQSLVSPSTEGGDPFCHKHALPAGLKYLKLGLMFNQPLSGSELPDGLEVLTLGQSFGFMSSVRWPSGLKELHTNATCVEQRIGGGFDRNIRPIELPPKLSVLFVVGIFQSFLTTFAWPSTLKILTIPAFDYKFDGADGGASALPDGLEELRLEGFSNHSIENVRLPVGLKRLILTSYNFNESLAGVMWPPGLEELELGDGFNQPPEGITFPETLRKLSFGEAFSCSLQGVALPRGLTRLSFGWNYPVSLLQGLDWPRSLRGFHMESFWFSFEENVARWTARQQQIQEALGIREARRSGFVLWLQHRGSLISRDTSCSPVPAEHLSRPVSDGPVA